MFAITQKVKQIGTTSKILLISTLTLAAILLPSVSFADATFSNKVDPVTPTPDQAACANDSTLKGCSTSPNANCGAGSCDIVKKYVNPAIQVATIVFGLIATISIILGGIQYSASAGDSQKVSAAKRRISMTVLAIVAYAFMYTFLQFLVPGGVFNHA
jgi:hypothetical protein